jgi:hypothetical protein
MKWKISGILNINICLMCDENDRNRIVCINALMYE